MKYPLFGGFAPVIVCAIVFALVKKKRVPYYEEQVYFALRRLEKAGKARL